MSKAFDAVLAKELIKRGLLTQEKADPYLRAAQTGKESFRTQAVQAGLVTEAAVLQVFSEMFKLRVVSLHSQAIQKDAVARIPIRFAWFYKFIPVSVEGKNLVVASAAPLNVRVSDEIRVNFGFNTEVLLAPEPEVLDALNRHYGLGADTIDRLAKDSRQDGKPAEETAPAVEDLEKQPDDASVARLVNQIILEAYNQRATDIHIEPYRNKIRVRYRIDGALMDTNVPAAVRQFFPSIISRIKIMANLSITERRVPQDGSAQVKTKQKDIDLRISTIPTPYGESMVIRILPTDVMLLSLDKLGLNPHHVRIFRQLVKKPHGIILVTGPTGSGKTTTLYACLHEINSPERKIITLEDPLEYEMEGITQIQVNPKVELTFAAGLRSILRHDPDIIMVGEIRDIETAEIAIRTALTGHLVFSTLHTNDAASGVTRLVEMGLEPFLVASSIEAFVAQRLVRKICEHCREEVQKPMLEMRQEAAAALGLKGPGEVKLFRGAGCDQCHQTGFYGRTAIYEVLMITEDIRAAILEKQRADFIKRLARQNGMQTLRQDGWRRVIEGVTTPTEIINVTAKDDPLKPENSPAKPAVQDVSSSGPSGTGPAMHKRSVPAESLSAKNDYDSRAYIRLKIKLPFKFSLLKEDRQAPGHWVTDGVDHAAVTHDVSAGGVRFVTGYALPVGTILEIKLQISTKEKGIGCLAKVCRVEEDSAAATFHIMAYYLDLSSADRVRLDQFVHKYLKPEPPSPSAQPDV